MPIREPCVKSNISFYTVGKIARQPVRTTLAQGGWCYDLLSSRHPIVSVSAAKVRGGTCIQLRSLTARTMQVSRGLDSFCDKKLRITFSHGVKRHTVQPTTNSRLA